MPTVFSRFYSASQSFMSAQAIGEDLALALDLAPDIHPPECLLQLNLPASSNSIRSSAHLRQGDAASELLSFTIALYRTDFPYDRLFWVNLYIVHFFWNQ
ncbi:unnamed protein product [Protopolystoma xenopodis]|uniref:Uncharacterized protein n=1 Tax=Protopolystoma xenopodis TaxID=117903 RepID=A0A448X5V7_9PLAT|nr:unnamed protein product [Protopolystoma xenopodis]